MPSDLLEWLNGEILDLGEFIVKKYNELKILIVFSLALL